VAEHATGDDDALELLADRATGDGRQVLTALEVCIALAGPTKHVTAEHAEAALGATALRYGRDEHYDVVSAFIKSIRGSDPDAAIHYLARMLEAGEDARFIARRLVILASEDVGMADPLSLVVADAAARAVEFVGLPEAQLNLAQATLHLAAAPKSNTAATAIWLAREDVAQGFAPEVPLHLRDGHPLQKRVEGRDYDYPHADPAGWVEQQYVAGDLPRPYYVPSEHGQEAVTKEALRQRREPRQ
jgi:putative ATPase